MPCPTTPGRRGGRPRLFDDEAVFAAVGHSLGRVGLRELGLSSVADELGCTQQALYKRFGSRRALLLGYASWSSVRSAESFREVREAHRSPLAALVARVTLPAEGRHDEMFTPTSTGRLLSLRLETADDPEFRAIWERRSRTHEREIVMLLGAARDAGELLEISDPHELGRTLHRALLGTVVQAVWSAEEPVEEQVRATMAAVLRPYVVV